MDDFFLFPVAHAGVITDAPTIATVLLRVLEFFLQVIGTVAIIAFVCSAFLYVFSSGNEKLVEMAKKWTLYSGVGCLIVFGALIIFSQISSFFS